MTSHALDELTRAIAPFVAAILAIAAATPEEKRNPALMISVQYRPLVAFLTLLVVFGVRLVAANIKGRSRLEADSPEGLLGALLVLRAAILTFAETQEICKGADYRSSLRIALHRIAKEKDAEFLEQVTDYVGGNRSGLGRRFPLRAGVIGKVALTGKVILATDMCGATDDDLVHNWKYTKRELPTLSRDREELLGVPVKDPAASHVIGVLFIDSTLKGLLANDLITVLAVEASGAIAEYIDYR